MVLENFRNENNKTFIETLSSINLGLHDGHIIKEFKTTDGTPCDLWEFLDSHRMSSKTHLYIVSEQNHDEAVDSEQKNAKQKTKPTVIHCSAQTQTIQSCLQFHDASTQTDWIDINDRCLSQIIDFKVGEECLENVDRNEEVEHEPNNEDDGSNDPDELIVVTYRHVIQSEYTGEFSTRNMTKRSLLRELKTCRIVDDKMLVEDFDPIMFGYCIAEIILNKDVLLEIISEGNAGKLERKFEFPMLQSYNYHDIAYNLDTLNCLMANGKRGYGVIVTCTDICEPIFTWYVNGKKYKEGPFLYWIEVDVNCQVTCSVSCKNIDPQLDVNSNNNNDVVSNDNLTANLNSKKLAESIPVISKADFKITKYLLGAGNQGTVRKGEYLGTKIAVKSINMINDTIAKNISNELSVIRVVRHPHVIQVIGVCFEAKKIHMLMELFVTLHDIMFDEDVKNTFHMSLTLKNSFAKQICLAVAYLHGQSPPILHRDIKSENILVNEHGFLKLGDLGTSKVCQPSTFSRTTTGVRGTYLYMAPELIKREKPASKNSDLWSVACVLVEIYSEKCVWNERNFHTETEFIHALNTGYTPCLDNIPEELKSTLELCFSIDPSQRPNIADLLKLFKEDEDDEI